MSTTVNAAKKRPAGASTNATPVARAVPAKLAVTPALKARAHKFMEDNALIQPGEEIDIPGGFSNKWVLDKVIPQKDGSGFLVMRLRAFKNGRPQRETVESAEILACSKGATQISKFETVRPPTKATFKFGYPKDNDASTGPSDRYYVELDGASAANAHRGEVDWKRGLSRGSRDQDRQGGLGPDAGTNLAGGQREVLHSRRHERRKPGPVYLPARSGRGFRCHSQGSRKRGGDVQWEEGDGRQHSAVDDGPCRGPAEASQRYRHR
jgi:hypothetical protein